MKYLKLAVIALAIIALALIAHPANAASSSCYVSPSSSAPVGTTFWIECSGFTPNVWTNIYAVEPDGRASGVNIYGFFPTSAKADESGVASFYFRTQVSNHYSVPVGNYTFVIHSLAPGGVTVNEKHVNITVESAAEAHEGAWLHAEVDGRDVAFHGGGFAPWEMVNVWVTQPPGDKCSGLGIDQLTLAALAGNGSSLWSGPGTVKADANGDIAFSIYFRPSACIGEHAVTVRAPASWTAGEVHFTINGESVVETGNVWIVVPDTVMAYNSTFPIIGGGFHPNEGVNCWFTRPDGRVLSFINIETKTNAIGWFSAVAQLDDFLPYTSTDPGVWQVTCATPNRAHLGVESFTVLGFETAP